MLKGLNKSVSFIPLSLFEILLKHLLLLPLIKYSFKPQAIDFKF